MAPQQDAPATILAPVKSHYEVLDGLRGTAAISILVFHFMELIWLDYSENPLGHGFLAVDFFFCLSGFVTGYAYDDRIRQMGILSFFKTRLIRLHPLVVLGSVLGLFAFLFDPFSINPYALGVQPIIIAFICSIFLIPMPGLPERAGALFPYNSPSWSLFMEYLANIAYALFLNRLHKIVMLLLAGLAAVWLLFTAYQAGTLIGGWDEKTWLDGIARVSFSFLAGLTVFRYGLMWRTRFGYLLLSVLLILTFAFPYFRFNWLAESLVVILVYPVIIMIGAGAIVRGRVRKICLFFGRLSYPLYMSHIVAIWCFGNYYAAYKPSGWLLFAIVSIGSLLLMGLGYLVMRFFDEPVRIWLKKKFD